MNSYILIELNGVFYGGIQLIDAERHANLEK